MFKSIATYAAVAAFGVLTSFSFDASAQSAVEPAPAPSVTVRYGDLDLNTTAGVDTLYARLRAAARQVCSVVDDRRPLAEQIAAKSCYRRALDAALDGANLVTSDALSRERAASDKSS